MVADVSVTRMGARGGETGQTVRQGDREREKQDRQLDRETESGRKTERGGRKEM